MSLESQNPVNDLQPSDRRTTADESVSSRVNPHLAVGRGWTVPGTLKRWIRRKAPLEIRQSHFVFLHDVFAAVIAFFLAYTVIGWGDAEGQIKLPGAVAAVMVVLISATVFAFMRLYRRLWQYTSIADISATLKLSKPTCSG